MIYFIIKIDSNKKEFIKIGYSQNSEKRLKQLQTGSSERLSIYCEIEVDKKLEKKLHKVWWKNRVRDDGEWLVLSTGLRMWLGRLREIGMIPVFSCLT